MAYTPVTVVSFGFPTASDPYTFTYLLTDAVADDTAAAALVGLAVEIDPAAASSVKLATNGGTVFGRIFSAERRTVDGLVTCAIQRKFKEPLPAAVGHGITVGKHVVGAGAGLVKLDPANTNAGLVTNPIVVETGTDYVVVEAF